MDGGAAETGIGQPVRRREDLRLLTGRGRYSDDLNLPGQAYAVMVRSPHAHALIRSIDTDAGAGRAGRAGGADRPTMLRADGLKPMPNIANRPSGRYQHREQGRLAAVRPEQHAIVGPEVRHVGEIVAMPWSRQSLAAAKDAAELRRGRLRATAGGRAHASPPPSPDAPRARRSQLQRHPRRRGRRCRRDRGGVRRGRACRPLRDLGAAHRRRADGAARRDRRVRRRDRPLHAACRRRRRGQPEARSGASCSASPPEQARVVMHDVGGNFGTRGGFNPEFALVAWAARRVGRAGQMDLRAQRVFLQRLPGARPRRRRRTGARRGRQVSRDARLQPRQPAAPIALAFGSAATRASRSCRASTTCRPCISAPAPR